MKTSSSLRTHGAGVTGTSHAPNWIVNFSSSAMCMLGCAGFFGLVLLLAKPVWAQNLPGEDPVILNKQVAIQMLPFGVPRSTPIDIVNGMPAWLKAKVVRYEAKANSDFTAGISTDEDVTRTVSSDGLKKTCVQEVGSVTTTTTANGATQNRNAPQVVVLKGDLVNICK